MYQQERLTGLYGVSLQEIQKQLKAWTEEYKGLEACADVYVKLADSYGQQGDRVRQLETAREGLRLYPRSQAAENLQCQIDEVLAPSLYARLPFVYPNQDVDLTVCYRNLKKVTFELYRLKLSPASPVLNGNLKKTIGKSIWPEGCFPHVCIAGDSRLQGKDRYTSLSYSRSRYLYAQADT